MEWNGKLQRRMEEIELEWSDVGFSTDKDIGKLKLSLKENVVGLNNWMLLLKFSE